MALESEQVAPAPVSAPSVFVAALGEAAQPKGFELLQALRRQGVAAAGEYEPKPLKRQLELANKLGCAYVLLLGDDELAKQAVTIRDMQQREQRQVAWNDCVPEMRRLTSSVPA